MRALAEAQLVGEFAPIMPGGVPEWDELYTFAADVVRDVEVDEYPEQHHVHAVVDAVSTLNNEQLERARYLALGYMIGSLALYLSEDDNQSQMTNLAAALLVEKHQEVHGTRDRSGLHLAEFKGDTMHLAFLDATQTAVERLPLEMRLMAESLQLVSTRRRSLPSEQAKLPSLKEAQGLLMSQLHVGRVAPVASTNLYRRALMDAYAMRLGISTADVRRQNPLLRQIKGVKAMEKIDMLHLGAYLARLRLDEINDPEITETHISRTPAGVYGFDHKFFRTDPSPPKSIVACAKDDVRVIHNERIGCPALYVRRMLRRILSIIPEVALLADAEIRGELG